MPQPKVKPWKGYSWGDRPEDADPSERLNVFLPKSLVDHLRKYCAARDVTMSGLVRDLIVREIGDPANPAVVQLQSITSIVAHANQARRDRFRND